MKIQSVIRNIFTKYNKNLRTVSAVKTSQYGRSMIEMLGVLAIIGVLSVGGIAGYSKAMFQIKLNKQAEQLTKLLHLGLIYGDSLGKQENIGGSLNLIPTLIAMNEVPEDMIKDNKTNVLYDAMGTPLYVRSVWESSGSQYQEIQMYLNNKTVETCKNIIKVAKQNYDQIWIFRHHSGYTLRGGKSCSLDKHPDLTDYCLKDVTISDIETICRACNEVQCNLMLAWNWSIKR